MTAHPIDLAIINGTAVDKAAVRGYEKARGRVRVADPNEVNTTDFTGQYAGVYVATLGRSFDLDPLDTISADDGVTILEDLVGNRFKVVSDSVAAPALGFILAYDYGVRPDTSADRTVEFQAAIDAAKDAISSPALGTFDTSVQIVIPPGVYCVSSLDMTGCAGIGLTSFGLVIIYGNKQVSSGKPIIDLTGSSSCIFRNIVVAGQNPAGTDPTIIPTVGWLVAETTAAGDSNKNRFEDCGSLGKFSVAALFVYGSTDNAWQSCAYQQDRTDALALYVGIVNDYGLTSPYQTIATAPTNAGDNAFYSCEFHGHRSSSAVSPTTRLYSVDNLRFYGGNHDNSGPHHILFNGTSKQVLISGMKFYSESGHAADDLIYSNNSAVVNLIIDCINTEDNAFSNVLINGTGTPTFLGGRIRGVKAASLSGPYLYFFAEPFPILGGPAINLAGNTTKYLCPGTFDATEANARMPMVRAVVLVGLRMKTGGSPGSGKSYVFTVRKNGVATAITASIANAATTANDLTHAVAFDAGDELSLEADPSTTADNTGSVYGALGFIAA